MNFYSYDIDQYDFRSFIANIFNCRQGQLNKIHEKYGSYEQFDMSNNSNTVLHDLFYNNLRSSNDFTYLYEDFINYKMTSIISEPFLFQTKPTLRIHFVGNWATPEFHTDAEEGYNHPSGEINFFLPLVSCYDTNALWVESEPAKADFAPITAEYGDLVGWSGGTLSHGNKINETVDTRVSLDFRILPISKYDPNYSKTSATSGTKFTIGGYYKECSRSLI